MSHHTTPARIEFNAMNGEAKLVLGVSLSAGNTITLEQALDDKRIATLLSQLAAVVAIRTERRGLTDLRLAPPSSLDEQFQEGLAFKKYPCPVALVPRSDNTDVLT